MGLFSSINIASSGMSAERLRTDVIADNMANVNTTRTSDGGPYRRSRVIFKPRVEQAYWRSPFLPDGMDNGIGKGVRVAEIQKDDAPARMVHNPTHPDAIKTGEWEGYVAMPNVDIITEMTDLIAAARAYEANASVVEGSKTMFLKALDIGSRI
ncbi:MAG: flagellar basal body rod protein FlgC [Spirochaetaceae bacterium]|jgi:flagellar basal-body rod protein FlgC|nr:flagellar basal body rod protein FlgC [Spirochaetaceae bacterium]